MLMRTLGRTGLRVAALCLGGNTFGWTTDQAASETVLDAYLEAGGNFIDTAGVVLRLGPRQKGGETGTVLGEWEGPGEKHGAGADGRKGKWAPDRTTPACPVSTSWPAWKTR